MGIDKDLRSASTHHYITTLLFLAVNRHDVLGSSLQHHGARLMGNDKDLPAHSLHHHYITTLLFLYSNGHDECFRGSHMHSLVFHRLQALSGLALRLDGKA